jgi:hypothetical protein
MKLEITILSEVSRAQTDKKVTFSLMWKDICIHTYIYDLIYIHTHITDTYMYMYRERERERSERTQL